MRNVTVAATQMACTWDREETLERAAGLVEEAAQKGANIVLLQELFETPYFCQQERTEYLKLATTVEENPAIAYFQKMAKQKELVIPVSFYEKAGNTAFNSVAVIDADGSIPGVYRKTHIPHSLLYEEKFYFTPGDTGFRAWKTQFGTIGVGICWDQWFPETARGMALQGAEILMYPTAIGSEAVETIDSMPHWRRCMTFYGSSFITDHTGQILQDADRESQTVLVQSFDLDEIEEYRRSWGVWRDRRPEMYGILTTHWM